MTVDAILLHKNETIDDLYLQFMDPENMTDRWLLIRSPGPIVTILALYLGFVLKLGPIFMKERKSYKLDLVMRVYNVVQILYNGYGIYLFLRTISGKTILGFTADISCSLSGDYEDVRSLTETYLKTVWHFLLIKIIDLLDTVFMVLRKKMSQVTFLHVYHHACTVFFAWYTFKYIKAPQAGFMLVINAFVHVVMYSYYFLATFDSLKKYLWWKQALTKLQLVQFVMVLGFFFTLYWNKCLVSPSFMYIWIFNVFVVMCLFLNFYIKSYVTKSAPNEINTRKLKVS